MDWKTIAGAILTALTTFLPPQFAWVAALAKSFLDRLNPTVPTALVGNAPDALKSWLHTFLQAEIAKLHMPFVKAILSMVVDKLDGAVMDSIWNALFPDKAVPVRMMAAGAHTVADFDAVVAEHLAA
jgi:hypothetical protein